MGEWHDTTLGELVTSSGGGIQTGPFGSQLHASDYVADGIPSVMPANIGENRIVEDGIARITEEDAQRLSRHRLVPGDIVYSRRGDVERRALVREENAGWLCGTGCLRVHFGPEPTADAAFVSYALGTEWTRSWIVQQAVGATMLNLNTGILASVPLSVPELGEQRAIAEVLGALDDKIAANTQLAATAEGLLRAQFECTRVDVEPFSSDEAVSVADLFEVNPRRARPSADEPVYVDMARLPTNSFSVSKWTRRAPRGGVRFTNGDTVMARITPCLENGKVGYIDFLASGEVGLGSTEYIVLRSRAERGVPLELSYFLARSPRFQANAVQHMVGSSGRQRLAGDDIKPFPLRRPDPSTLARFGEMASPIFHHMRSLIRENVTLAATRDTLLPQLMLGKLRVREAAEMAGL